MNKNRQGLNGEMMKRPIKIDEDSRFVFISSVIIMILTHGFCFTNLMYSNDSLFFSDIGGLDKVALGRWLYPFVVHRRLIATPLLMGTFSIIYVSLAVVIVTKLLDFNRIQGVCVGILFGTNISLICLFCSYVFDADADCLGLFLACLAVYAFRKLPRYLNIVVPAVLLMLCLALYQAYISVAVGLYIAVLIRETSRSGSWKDVYKCFILGLKELTTLALATAIYLPLMYVSSVYYGVKLSSGYNGAGKLGSITFRDVINGIPKAYEYFRDFFLDVTEYNTGTIVMINWIMIICLVISVVAYIIIHVRFEGSLVIILPCILIMPVALNSILLVSFGKIHHLMIFALGMAYLLPMILVYGKNDTTYKNDYWGKIMSWARKTVCTVSVLAVFVVGFNNMVYANGAYVYKKLIYDNTALHAQTIWKDINSIDGYSEGETQVVFMGNFPHSSAGYNSSVGDRYHPFMHGVNKSAISNDPKVDQFYSAILGRNLNIICNDKSLFENQEYLDMPVYPKNGYCKMIGDKVVVKLKNKKK